MEAVGAQATGHLIRLMRGNGMSAFLAIKYYLSCRMHWLEKTAVAVDLKLPELRTIADAQNALAAIVAGTANGTILSDGAATLASVITTDAPNRYEIANRWWSLSSARAIPTIKYVAGGERADRQASGHLPHQGRLAHLELWHACPPATSATTGSTPASNPVR